MAKLGTPVIIPDHIAGALKAMAEHQGISEGELVVRILEGVLGNRFLKSYVKNGKFDQQKWREDRKRARAKLNAWHRTHPEEGR